MFCHGAVMDVLTPTGFSLSDARGAPSSAIETLATRIKRLRRARSLTQEDLADLLNVTRVSVARWESGQRSPTQPDILKLAHAFSVTPNWLHYGGHGGPQTVPVIGHVGAAQEVRPFDAEPLDEIEAPFGCPPDTRALIVRGDSMMPELQDGDLVLYRGVPQDPATLIGRRCIVRLEDGRVLVKRLRRGAELGTYDLESTNAAPIEAARLVWCARVEAVVFRK